MTPLGLDRQTEIREWLRIHAVEAFVILDDVSEELESFQSSLVLCNGMTGLTLSDAFKAISILT